jgi:transcriptional regulator with XRE-family HTH domain
MPIAGWLIPVADNLLIAPGRENWIWKVDVTEALGANVKRVRNASGLSQDAVSIKADLHRTAVSEIEAGRSDARASTLLKLAGVLEVDVGEFFRGMSYKPATTERGGFELQDK